MKQIRRYYCNECLKRSIMRGFDSDSECSEHLKIFHRPVFLASIQISKDTEKEKQRIIAEKRITIEERMFNEYYQGAEL